MRHYLLGQASFSAVISAMGVLSATALPIEGLWNTGVDASGTPQGVGFNEVHYTATLPLGSDPRYEFRTVAKPGSYVSNPTDAAWIGPSLTADEGALVDDPVGTYVYKMLFSLEGISPSSALISGMWSSDNWSSIWLNGVETAYQLGKEDFRTLTSFNLYDGILGISGDPIYFDPVINSLEFHVINARGSGNPSALLVSGLSGTGQSVADGGSMVLMVGGAFAAMFAVSRAFARSPR